MLQILDNNRLRQAPSLQMNNLPVRECSLGYVIHFEILGPLNIFGMFKDKYFLIINLLNITTINHMINNPLK